MDDQESVERSSGCTPLMARLLEFSPPSLAEEQAIGRRARRGDVGAQWELVLRNARLAYSFASRYMNKGGSVPLSDLFSAALLGMFEGAQKFCPGKGKFSVFASVFIKRNLVLCHASFDRAFRVPYRVKRGQVLAFKLIGDHEILADMGKEEIAAILSHNLTKDAWDKLSAEQKNDFLTSRERYWTAGVAGRVSTLSAGDFSLDAPSLKGEPDGGSVGEIIADPDATLPMDAAASTDDQALLRKLLGTLSPRDCEIMKHRWGLDGCPVETLDTLGKRYSITHERIRQVEFNCMRKLRFQAMKLAGSDLRLRKVA